MKIKTLITQLTNYMRSKRNVEVRVSVDEEGNDFKEVDGVYGLEDKEYAIIYPYG